MPNPGSTGRAGKRLLSPVGVCGGGGAARFASRSMGGESVLFGFGLPRRPLAVAGSESCHVDT